MEDIWEKIWRDKHGDIVVWQTPNVWLIGWAILNIVSLLLNGHLSDIFAAAGDISLVIWCGLEIFKGANYFRRVLGVLVLIFAIASLLKAF